MEKFCFGICVVICIVLSTLVRYQRETIFQLRAEVEVTKEICVRP